jgi:Histidine kinase-, DNA gyrase B-, and HSP90-like ATPase
MHDLSLYLLDILENSVRAGATVIATTIDADRARDALTIWVEDDGPGLPVEPERALDPFFTTKADKKTGLGLSLFRQAAEAARGGLTVGRSNALGGVSVTARMSLTDVDRPPLGDMAASIATMVVTNPEIEFRVDLNDDGTRTSLRGPEVPQRLAELVSFQEALP